MQINADKLKNWTHMWLLQELVGKGCLAYNAKISVDSLLLTSAKMTLQA